MKSIMGIYDASLGARGNETSGRAILARQREGDVSTFHFIDNLARSIRHVGCVLLDMIPKVYNGQRVIRIIGADETERTARVGKPDENGPLPDGAERIYDLSLGRYDVAVDTGPSFTTRREETAMQMTELIRAYPPAAPLIGDLLVKALDWPNADEIAERIKSMMPPQANGGLPPELQKMMADGKQMIDRLQAENMQLKSGAQSDAVRAEIDRMKVELDRQKVQIEAYKAETERMQAEQAMAAPLPPVQPAASPVSVSIPETLGESVLNSIGPAVAQAVSQAVGQLPPLQVNMPPPVRMRRRPVRDKNGLIVETIDEPINEMVN